MLYFGGTHSSSASSITIVTHNLLRFVTESTPILFTIAVAVFGFYLAKEFLAKRFLEVSIVEVIAMSYIVFNWVAYLFGTGWYRYFFPAHLLVYVFFIGAYLKLSKYFFDKPVLLKLLKVFSIFLIIFQFVHLVFISDTSFVIKRTRNSELQQTLSKIDSSHKVLFYNSIEASVFLNSSNYNQFLSMDDFLVAGDKSAIKSPTEDFILVSNDSVNSDQNIRCYEKSSLGKYYLYKKKVSCM